MRLATSLILAVLLATTATAWDLATVRSEGLGGAIALSRPTASDLVELPVAALDSSNYLIDFGALRQYELSEFDQAFLAAAGRYRMFTAALGFSFFGEEELMLERKAKLSLGATWKYWQLGANISWRHLSFGGGFESLSAATFGLSAGVHYQKVHFALSGDNLSSPKLHQAAPPEHPRYTLLAEIEGRGSYSIIARATSQKDQDLQLAIGQLVQVTEYGLLFWGISTKPMKYGGGLQLTYGSAFISYAASYHPDLGFSQTLSLSFGFGSTTHDHPVARSPLP